MLRRFVRLMSTALAAAVLAIPTASAAPATVRVDTARSVFDGVTHPSPRIVFRVEARPGALVDVRVVRYDPDRGTILKEILEEDCESDWAHDLWWRNVPAGTVKNVALPRGMPMGPYAVAVRAPHSNGPFEVVTDTFEVTTESLWRHVICELEEAVVQHAKRPALAGHAQHRAVRSTVRVHSEGMDGTVGQGVVLNPFGHVATAASVVKRRKVHYVTFPSGSLSQHAGEYVLPYRLLDEVARPGTAPAVFPENHDTREQVAILVPLDPKAFTNFEPHYPPLADRERGAKEADVLAFHSGLLAVNRSDRRRRRVISVPPAGGNVYFGPDGYAKTVLSLKAYVHPEDVGGPLFDTNGRVWAVLTGMHSGVWAADLVARYREWHDAGALYDVLHLKGGAK